MSIAIRIAALACCAGITGCASSSADWNTQYRQREALEAQLKQMENGMKAASVAAAVANGQAVVVTPLFNRATQFHRPEITDEQFSRRVTWEKTGQPQARFTVEKDGVINSTLGEVQQFFIVEPGTYRLASIEYEVPETTTAQITAKRERLPAPLGSILLTEGRTHVMRETQEWHPDRYTTQSVRTTRCVVVHAAGHCLSSATRDEDVQVLTQQAGWYNTRKAVETSKVSVEARPAKDFATFTVMPGEIVLVDGFVAKIPAVSFDPHACHRVDADTLECRMTQIELQRIPGRFEELKAAIPTIQGHPELVDVLSHIEHRAPDIKAKAGWTDAAWGRNYYLTLE